mgnify:CR=1 FL=1
MRYELVPVTHHDLVLLCLLGGRIYLHNESYSGAKGELYFYWAHRFDFDDPMRGDCYLIGSIGDNFNKLTLKEQKEIFDESKRYAYGRDDHNTPKTNTHILVIHEI